MRVQLLEAAHDLFEDGMTKSTFHTNDDGLLHLVGNDLTDALLAMTTILRSSCHIVHFLPLSLRWLHAT